MEQLSDEEILWKEASEPGEAVESIQLLLPDDVRHAHDAADAKRVEGKVITRHAAPKVDLRTPAKHMAYPEPD